MPTHCPMAVAFTTEGDAKLLYCGKWACKVCAKKNARKWSIHAYHGITKMTDKGAKVHFWTFTMGKGYTRPSQAYAVLPRLWDTLRKAIQRQHKQFQFIAFVEGQPERDNMPHFHIITMQTIPKGNSKRKDPLKWIKDFAVRCGFGPQATDELITSLRAAAYVTKYASKGCPEIPKNFRRVRCSRDWQKAPDKEYDAYIVRSVGETIDAYLLRVEDASDVPLDDLIKSYQHASINLTYERERNI